MQTEDLVRILRGLKKPASPFSRAASRVLDLVETGARVIVPEDGEEGLPGGHFARLYETRALLPDNDPQLQQEAVLLAEFFSQRAGHQFTLASILADDLKNGVVYLGNRGEHAAF